MQFPWAQTFVPSPLGVRVPASLYSEKSLWGKEPQDGGEGGRLSGRVPMPTEYPPQRAEQMS